VAATPDISWSIDPGVPAGSFWRIMFRPTDATGDAVSESVGQVRTPFMQSGDYGLSIAGTTATWTNPGSLVLPAGTYEVQIRVYDDNAGFSSTVLGSNSGPGGVGGDLIYIATGSFAAGQTKYADDCGSCHAAGTYDINTSSGASDLYDKGELLITNISSYSPTRKTGVADLTPQEILDLTAFLESATIKP
jgi:hypothetical protein